MKQTVPMKDSKIYTESISIRVEPELKESFRKLSYMGVDLPELIRRSIRETLDAALKAVHTDKPA